MTGETGCTEYIGAINVSFEAKTLLDSDDKRGPVKSYLMKCYPLWLF